MHWSSIWRKKRRSFSNRSQPKVKLDKWRGCCRDQRAVYGSTSNAVHTTLIQTQASPHTNRLPDITWQTDSLANIGSGSWIPTRLNKEVQICFGFPFITSKHCFNPSSGTERETLLQISCLLRLHMCGGRMGTVAVPGCFSEQWIRAAVCIINWCANDYFYNNKWGDLDHTDCHKENLWAYFCLLTLVFWLTVNLLRTAVEAII